MEEFIVFDNKRQGYIAYINQYDGEIDYTTYKEEAQIYRSIGGWKKFFEDWNQLKPGENRWRLCNL